MKSEWCAKLCGSATWWALHLQERLLHGSRVSLLCFFRKNWEAFYLFFPHDTHVYFFTGDWEMVHESHKLMDTNFDPFLKGEHATFFFLTYKFSSGMFLREICFCGHFQVWKLQDGTWNELCWTGMSGGWSGKQKATELSGICSHFALFFSFFLNQSSTFQVLILVLFTSQCIWYSYN